MSARTPIRLVADTDDDECGFILYDPQATMGVEQGVGDWDDKRRELYGFGTRTSGKRMADSALVASVLVGYLGKHAKDL